MAELIKTTELKPCPFCGDARITLARHPGAGRGMLHKGDDVFSIDCYGCGASVPNRYKQDVIIAAWNRRS